MEEQIERLHARLLYLEGIVAALIALHPQAEELEHFTPEIVDAVKRERDIAESQGQTKDVAKFGIWLDAFESAQGEIHSDFGYSRDAFKLPPIRD